MVLDLARVLTDATVSVPANAANALVAGVPRQAWKLGKSGSSRAKATGQARTSSRLWTRIWRWCGSERMWFDVVLISQALSGLG